ncbi:hypothetical protein ACFY8O_16070 [Streptomyces argenteolus]|uniref:Uncharacterized protein n=1 Tax=Streptomyces argenteolus TaxID=67274 RepID=A0ABW6X5S4_9ACTN
MRSSVQPSVPGSPKRFAPVKARACHRENTAPDGSAATANLPRSKTSMGAISTVPPAERTARAESSASSVAKETVQAGGCSGR